ncbi:AP2-like ethylene-responsive transcription factor AIL5 [Glycine soja]|nr:AP2-like ethylene-responsive transcription factor AIL5 [Glycine soja]
MDSSSSSPPNSTNNNSLAFSLSNHFPNPSSSPLSLFHSFTYPSLSLTATRRRVCTATASAVLHRQQQPPIRFGAEVNNSRVLPSRLGRRTKHRTAKTIPQENRRHLRATHLHLPRHIDGLGDTKLIYGTIVAEGKVKAGKEGKILTVLCFVSLRGFCTWGIIADSWGSFAHYAVSVYLGGYDKEDKAARAYDLAALKYWGPTTTTNFPISNYEKELEEMKNMTRQEFVASLRRKSSGFSRGASIYRGVTRHHQHGRWQARIGRVAGNKDLYLGTFSTQEEAAEAYDIAAIKFRGLNAVTNFDMSRYDVKSIANSTLPIGGLSGKNKNSTDSASESKSHEPSQSDGDPSSASSQDPSDYWSILGYHNTPLDNSGIRNTTSTVTTTTFPSSNNGTASSLTPFNMEFSSAPSSTGSDNNAAFFSGGGIFVQQQTSHGHGNGSSGSSSSSLSCSIPFATPIFSLNSNTSYESSAGYGNWIGPTLHTFQSHAKPSLFQTPIFGME